MASVVASTEHAPRQSGNFPFEAEAQRIRPVVFDEPRQFELKMHEPPGSQANSNSDSVLVVLRNLQEAGALLANKFQRGTPSERGMDIEYFLLSGNLARWGQNLPQVLWTKRPNRIFSEGWTVSSPGNVVFYYPSAVSERGRATAEEASPGLPAEFEAAIAELVKLPKGWDGYKGIPVRPEVAERARRFMEVAVKCTQFVPDVVPLSDGGLQLEWFVGAYEIEVLIASDGVAQVCFECTDDGQGREFSLGEPFDIDLIAPVFRDLRR